MKNEMVRKPPPSPLPLGDKGFCCSLFFVAATLQTHMFCTAINTFLQMSELIYSLLWKENKASQFLNPIMTINSSSCLKIAQIRN